jgi:hypothetical protein
VREHGPKGDVAYAFDVRGGCGILRIDNDAAFRVEGDTGGSEVKAFNIRTAANSDEYYVSFELEKSKTSASWYEKNEKNVLSQLYHLSQVQLADKPSHPSCQRTKP